MELDISSNQIKDQKGWFSESNLSYLGKTMKKLEVLDIYYNPVCPGYTDETTKKFAKQVKDKIPTVKRLNWKDIEDLIKNGK